MLLSQRGRERERRKKEIEGFGGIEEKMEERKKRIWYVIY